MESLFASIDYRDPVWIAVAFAFGFAVSQIGLPPLVGFLVAGFALNALGAEGGAFLNEMADLGVTLLLFSIGLKLRVGQLLRPETWGVATAHMLAVTLLASAVLMLLSSFDLPLLNNLTPASALLVGFALSFSSTVFAVKVLEDKSDTAAWYGRIAIGVLIVQDIAAVIFLGVSAAKVPSPWAAFVIVGILASRPLLNGLLSRAGHGELQILFGLVLALGGAGLFELVDLKGDLGALVFGVLIANHPKAGELFKVLLSLKDLFLVGFFLSIGLTGIPDLTLFLIAAAFALFIPVKIALYFWLFTRFRVRARTATLASQTLANFSEFGLIVTAIATGQGWLSKDWLVVAAVGVALSFVIASALNANADRIYLSFRPWLKRFENRRRLVGDETVDFDGVRILVCGMGRVGTGAYDQLVEQLKDGVIGLDFDPAVVTRLAQTGRNIQAGNLTNPDFWTRIDRGKWHVDWVLLAMPTLQANQKAARLARDWGFRGRVGAAVKFADEAEALQECGVDAVFNIYAEAGSGFANHAMALFAEADVANDTT